MRTSAIDGSSRCVNESRFVIQKSPSMFGAEAPIVAIGRLLMAGSSEYSCQPCSTRSAKMRTATMTAVKLVVRAVSQGSGTAERQPDADGDRNGDDEQPEHPQPVHPDVVEQVLQGQYSSAPMTTVASEA
jgi:hypothetical protein